MIKQDILGGLKLAISKGESLKQSMISFHNAGYKKENIENAARTLLQIQRPQQTQPAQHKKFIPQPKKQILQPVKTIQKVSGYGQEPTKLKQKLVLFLFIFILIILLGTLASIFIFKSDVMNFLNRLFI